MESLDYEPGVRDWKCPSNVRDHAGGRFPQETVFFHAPPEDLGELISAHSTMRRGREMKSTTARALIGVSIGLPAAILVGLIVWASEPRGWDQLMWLLPLLMFAIGFGAVWLLTRFSHTCSFVGTNGICRYSQTGSRNASVNEDLFYFHNAAELRAVQTRQYVNRVYTGTAYDFSWTDSAVNSSIA